MQIISRPWGTYQTIIEDKNYKVKKIVVYPNSQLSLQSHKHRSEHWVIVSGSAIVDCNDKKINLNKDEHIYIDKNIKHRISNFTNENIVFIEVQNGDYLGEDDIIRYEDIYGRK